MTPAGAAAGITFAFVLVTIWWLTHDSRVPEFDPGLHMGFAFQFHDEIASGNVLGPFKDWTQYPPLVHMLGAFATFVAGKDIWPGVMAENLIFVPLLALGCYGAAREVYRSELAGLLAVVFALGTPMIVSQLHMFMIDAPETALVAVSVWLLLASRNFERVGIAALAGLAVGFGLLTKESFVAFVAGAAVVVVAHGLWRRNWRGLLVFAAVVAAVGAPWYIHHWEQVQGLGRLTSSEGFSNAPGGGYPLRYSTKNAGWFLWSGLNLQNFAPMLGLAAAGAVMAVVNLFRRPPRQQLTIVLLAGGLVAWLGATYSLPHDPRYSLPALPYLAVLGGGWIVTLPRPRLRLGLAALLGAVAFANLFAISTGLGRPVVISLPGAPAGSPLHERQLTLLSDKGYGYNQPERSGDMPGLLRSLHKRGIRYVLWDFAAANTAVFNTEGLSALAQVAGLSVANSPHRPPTDTAFLTHQVIAADATPPCRRLYDGTGVWVTIPTRPPVDACPR